MNGTEDGLGDGGAGVGAASFVVLAQAEARINGTISQPHAVEILRREIAR